MSMNPEQENFGNLRRLLKLKRYEQPHPRYFNDFSGRVIARIQAGEEGGEAALGPASWLVKFWSLFEAKPMLPGAIGVALCALLVFVAIGDSGPGPEFPDMLTTPSTAAPIFAVNHDQGGSSTNPVIQLRGDSLFDQFDQIRLSESDRVRGGTSLIPFRGN